MKLLQRTQGMGVRPAAYSETKSEMTSSRKASSASYTKCGNPTWPATDRASAIPSRPQQVFVGPSTSP